MRLLLTAIWFLHIVLCAGAGWAVLRLWYHRYHPLMGRMGIYMLGFVAEGAVSTTLLAITSTQRTWTFVLVWCIGTLITDLPRVPLIVYIIRGPGKGPPEVQSSGSQPVEFWLEEGRRIVREEIQAAMKQFVK